MGAQIVAFIGQEILERGHQEGAKPPASRVDELEIISLDEAGERLLGQIFRVLRSPAQPPHMHVERVVVGLAEIFLRAPRLGRKLATCLRSHAPMCGDEPRSGVAQAIPGAFKTTAGFNSTLTKAIQTSRMARSAFPGRGSVVPPGRSASRWGRAGPALISVLRFRPENGTVDPRSRVHPARFARDGVQAMRSTASPGGAIGMGTRSGRRVMFVVTKVTVSVAARAPGAARRERQGLRGGSRF
jgi:hypothetical protein